MKDNDKPPIIVINITVTIISKPGILKGITSYVLREQASNTAINENKRMPQLPFFQHTCILHNLQ